jgi:hypothetical protein
MIYLYGDGKHQLIILEPAEIDHLKAGGVIKTEGNAVALMYTPDAPFMAGLMKKAQEREVLTAGAIDVMHTESMRRAPNYATHKPGLMQLIPTPPEEAHAETPAEQG